MAALFSNSRGKHRDGRTSCFEDLALGLCSSCATTAPHNPKELKRSKSRVLDPLRK